MTEPVRCNFLGDVWTGKFLVLALVAMAACELGGGDPGKLDTNGSVSAAVAEREVDGARVAIFEGGDTTVVRTLDAAWDAADEGWMIAHGADLKIGAPRGGDDSEALWRVESAVLRADGRVFVANTGSLEVKAFSPEGGLLWITGGEGQGPGEFQSFGTLHWCSESVVVTDWQTQRVTQLDAAGEVITTMPWRPLQRDTRPVVFHCDSTGTVARIERDGSIPSALGPHSREALLAVGTLSETPVILGDVGEFDRYRSQNTDMPALLGKSVFAAASKQAVHVLVGDKPEILTYDLQGQLVRRAKWEHEQRRVTSKMLEEEGDHGSRVLPRDRRASYVATWLDMEHPEFLPVVAGLIAATDGDLWVKQFQLEMEESDPEVWWIVSANGALRGGIQVPRGFELLSVGVDTVLGLTKDEDGNDYIELRALMRSVH